MSAALPTMFHHLSVLKDEVLELLGAGSGASGDALAGLLIVDATLGGGGHSQALLQAGARIIGVDRDPNALAAASERLAEFGDRFEAVSSPFSELPDLLRDRAPDGIDGLLADLGVSSHQLDTPERGFSLRDDGPLDMRMDPRHGVPLSERLQDMDEAELADALRRYGEERRARRVARAILTARDEARLTSTSMLAEVISRALGQRPRRGQIHPATRSFQALRILINDELGELDALLSHGPSLLRSGGRMAVISFHSLEDRAVKQRFRRLAGQCTCPPGLPVCVCGARSDFDLLTRRAVKPTAAEIDTNPRARSARLRALQRRQRSEE